MDESFEVMGEVCEILVLVFGDSDDLKGHMLRSVRVSNLVA